MRKGNSTQELIGIKGFTKNCLKVGRTEFILYQVQPTNISVLSPESIDFGVHLDKYRHLSVCGNDNVLWVYDDTA